MAESVSFGPVIYDSSARTSNAGSTMPFTVSGEVVRPETQTALESEFQADELVSINGLRYIVRDVASTFENFKRTAKDGDQVAYMELGPDGAQRTRSEQAPLPDAYDPNRTAILESYEERRKTGRLKQVPVPILTGRLSTDDNTDVVSFIADRVRGTGTRLPITVMRPSTSAEVASTGFRILDIKLDLLKR